VLLSEIDHIQEIVQYAPNAALLQQGWEVVLRAPPFNSLDYLDNIVVIVGIARPGCVASVGFTERT